MIGTTILSLGEEFIDRQGIDRAQPKTAIGIIRTEKSAKRLKKVRYCNS